MTQVPFTQRATTPGMPAAGLGVVHPPCAGVGDDDVPGVAGNVGAPEDVDGASGVASGTPVVAEG
jgi:hypothetical protein